MFEGPKLGGPAAPMGWYPPACACRPGTPTTPRRLMVCITGMTQVTSTLGCRIRGARGVQKYEMSSGRFGKE